MNGFDARSQYLPILIQKVDIRTQLLSRFISFWSKCKRANVASELSMENTSTVADNLREVLSYLDYD